MSEAIAIIATCDTQGEEALYLKQRIESYDMKELVVDPGILGKPVFVEPDVIRDELAGYSGFTIKELVEAGSRGAAVEKMKNLRPDIPIIEIDAHINDDKFAMAAFEQLPAVMGEAI